MRLLSWLLSLPIFVAVIIFVLQNRMQVSLSFWPFDAEVTMPVSVLSLGLLILGFVCGSLLTGLALFRAQFEARGLRKQVAQLSEERDAKTPLSCEPTILYNGRYHPISTLEENSRPLPKKTGWFGKRKP